MVTTTMRPAQFVAGSDWHHDRHRLYPGMVGHIIDASEAAAALAAKLDAVLISGGDRFHPLSGLIPIDVFQRVYEMMKRARCRVIELDGNHGRAKTGLFGTMISPFDGLENVQVITQPVCQFIHTQEDQHPTMAFFVPYCDTKEEFIEHVQAFHTEARNQGRQKHVPLLFVHQGFAGGWVGPDEPGYQMGEDQGAWTVPEDLFVPFLHVFAGHFHKHQTVQVGGRKLTYIGAPLQHNFGDRGQDRGILVVGCTPKGVTIKRELFDFPRFEKVRLTATNFEEELARDWSNTYLKPIIADPSIEDKLELFQGQCLQLMPADIEPQATAENRIDDVTVDSLPEEILAGWLNALYPDLSMEEREATLVEGLRLFKAVA